jgi:hypothetical protein
MTARLDMSLYSLKGMHIVTRRTLPVPRINFLLNTFFEGLAAEWIRHVRSHLTQVDNVTTKARLNERGGN